MSSLKCKSNNSDDFVKPSVSHPYFKSNKNDVIKYKLNLPECISRKLKQCPLN